MQWEHHLRQLAAGQAGVVGIDQLSTIGCTWNHWARARRNGRWVHVTRRVLAVSGAPPSDDQRVWAALLDAGGNAHLHGPSALAWFGQRGYDLSTIHVTRRRGVRQTTSELAVVHQLRDLRPCDLCVVRGVPTVTALRAIWSEASRFSSERLHEVGKQRIGRILDDAHVAGLITWPELHRSVDELERRGRAGTVIMRELADERPIGSSATESRNEDRLEAVLAGHHLPRFERQIVVGEQTPIGRCDFRDPELPLTLEVNSLTFHSTPSDQQRDELRYEALVAAGFGVAVVWEPDLWSRPANVVRTVKEARRRVLSGPTVVHSAGCPWPHDPARFIVDARRRRLRG